MGTTAVGPYARGAACALCAAAALCLAPVAGAVGTPAGEDIANTATATWTAGGPAGPISASVTFLVDERIEIDVALQNAGPVVTVPGATGEVLTFLLTNQGNGSETFALFENAALAGDDFDPIPAGIFLDGNGNGVYDAGVDPAYVPGANDPTLDANTPGAETALVFLVNDIPAGPAANDTGDAELRAESTTYTGAPGTFAAGAGDGGTNAVAGTSGGLDADRGTYVISDTLVSVVKSAAVDDGFGGSRAAPGSTITYSLDVTVAGTQTAGNVVITDPIPTNTTYTTNTIFLNGLPLTDLGGDDAGDYNATNPNTITVGLGDLDSTSPVQTITFQVTID